MELAYRYCSWTIIKWLPHSQRLAIKEEKTTKMHISIHGDLWNHKPHLWHSEIYFAGLIGHVLPQLGLFQPPP